MVSVGLTDKSFIIDLSSSFKKSCLYLTFCIVIICVAGLSSYGDNPSEAGPDLSPCVTNMTNEIPESVRNSSAMYLGATAGMRLLE